MAQVLVIDDDVMFLTILVALLTEDAHRVTVAHDGEEGLRLIKHNRFDLIITDILMPNKDGIEFIMELAREHSHIPVIAMSGGRRSVSSKFNLESAALLGVKATLAKPFSKEDLRQAINKALG